jgi:protein Xni
MQPTDSKGHLLLIDGLNIVRRVYEANPSADSPEKAETAIRNSLSSFRRALAEHQPTHVLAPFDHGGQTWRHELYPNYRCKRKPMPQALRDALPALFGSLHELGVTTLSIPGVEADDVVATAFYRWDIAKRGPVTVLSNDKDLGQLAADGARVRDHFNSAGYDEEFFLTKFGVKPALIHDLLALTGDSSDDVPGVPGVAFGKGAKLLNTYGSLDAVIAAAPQLKGKLGENLRASIELVRLSRQLVAFKTDIPLGLTWNALRFPKAPA